MENAPNYNQWLYELVKPYIGKRVLEVGSGTGNISLKVIKEVDVLVGIEPNQYCFEALSAALKDKSNFIPIHKSIEECRIEDLKPYEFDTILCMNVLEHILDDINIVLFFETLVKPGGTVILLVPAFPQAYGPIDKAVGHFRRYTKSSMKDLLSKTKLRIEFLAYSNSLGLMGWFFNARIRKSTSQNDLQIRLFDKLVPLLSLAEKKLGCPMGLSLISVFRKNNEPSN